MIATELLAAVGLNAHRHARKARGVSETVEDHVAEIGIGRELRLRIADKGCDLQVQLVAGILIGGDAVMRDLALVLVEPGGVECVAAVDLEARLYAGDVGDFEMADEAAAENC